MRRSLIGLLLLTAIALSLPGQVTAQGSATAGSFRAYVHVLLAFAAGWVLIAAWVFQIGRKVNLLAKRMEEDGASPHH